MARPRPSPSARGHALVSRSVRLAVAPLIALAVTMTAAPASGSPRPQDEPGNRAGSANSVDFGHRLQSIDGFGFSQAFQRAAAMDGLFGLTPENQREVLHLLLSRKDGAGLSILRLGIGAAPDDPYDEMKSIQPENPGGPDAPPQYVWDGYDGGQVWLAEHAKRYGVRRFYADAWSAPGYMKTNGVYTDGGRLCGVPGTDCESGDWRQAYADYLVQYLRFYRQEGIRITDLGFTNEPDLAVSYASMQFNGEQAADFIKVLGPTLQRSYPRTNLVCCDAAGWDEQVELTEAIKDDRKASKLVDFYTAHPYVNPADEPLPTRKHTWMSEWQPNGDTWTEAWDDGTGWDGMSVAEHIHDSLTVADVNAYVYWFAASLGATRAFIQLDEEEYHVSKRLWAMAAYSRFVRPGAVRVAAEAADPDLKVSAYRNKGGSKVIEILNTGTEADRTTFALRGGHHGRPVTYLTDETHSLERTRAASKQGRNLSVELPPRSLTTVVLRR